MAKATAERLTPKQDLQVGDVVVDVDGHNAGFRGEVVGIIARCMVRVAWSRGTFTAMRTEMTANLRKEAK